MKYINLENLPKKPHNATMCIDWKLINGEKVYFEFKDVKGYVTMYYSHTKRKYDHYIKCIYNGKEKTYPCQLITKGELGSLVKPHPKWNKPTEENWLYNRKDLHKFVDNPEDLKNYHASSSKNYDFKCPSCNKKFDKKICAVYQNGMNCDRCSSSYSRNERLVSSILTKMNEKYIPQKYFKDCVMKKQLPFDFYLPNRKIVIETHGEQHYKDIGYFDNHKITVKADGIKKEYCKNNGIKYCEINCSTRKAEDIIKQLKTYINISLSDEELQLCIWESSHNVDEIDIGVVKNLHDCYWNSREIAEYLNTTEGKVKGVLDYNNMKNETNYSTVSVLVDLVTSELYSNCKDLIKKKSIKNYDKTNRKIKQGKPIEYNNNLLCIVKREDLLFDKDKSHLKKVYNEAMKQLNENKENPFEKYVNCNIDDLIDNSDNQQELILHLDNLPKEYCIENGVILKK